MRSVPRHTQFRSEVEASIVWTHGNPVYELEPQRYICAYRQKAFTLLIAGSELGALRPSVARRARTRRGSEVCKFYVIQQGQEWKIIAGSMHFGPYVSRAEAIRIAVGAAHDEGIKSYGPAQVLVQEQDGTFRVEWTFGVNSL